MNTQLNIKGIKQERGFTIVELLIVIVVIAILAAISIVAYNGVTKKANAAAAKSNAAAVQKVAEAYNADERYNVYPTQAQVLSFSADSTAVTRVPTGVTVSTLNPTAANGKTTIGYKEVGTSPNFTGGCIAYFNFDTNAVNFIYAGNATTGGGAAGVATTCA